MRKPIKEPESKVIGTDLLALATLLTDAGICLDISSLNTAGNVCSKLPEDEPWKYKLGQLDFRIDAVGSMIPGSAEGLTLRFSMSISSNALAETIIDPLNELTFDIEIFGVYPNEKAGDVTDVYCSWHLDRHISAEGDGQSKYSHPLYHLTFGGRKMEEKKLDYGSTLIMPSPRIAYPPMDAVLGIDFILKNYFHRDTIKQLVQSSEYLEIVSKSQERLWRPYYTSVSAKWINITGVSFDKAFTFEHLMPFFQKN